MLIAPLLIAPLLASLAGPPAAQESRSPVERAITKMRAQGYRMLVDQFRCEKAGAKYGDFEEVGTKPATTYDGRRVPAGQWVWSKPYWFVWHRKSTGAAPPDRSYGPEQATGEPNSPKAGDSTKAWCSKTSNAGREWLLLEYGRAVLATKIEIHENYQHGALERVTVFGLGGKEVEVHENAELKGVTGRRELKLPVVPGQRTMRVKLYFDTKKAPIWNEIDAVGIVDNHGKKHWAESAHASSSYGVTTFVPMPPVVVGIKKKDKTAELEKELVELRKLVEKLRERIEVLEREKKRR